MINPGQPILDRIVEPKEHSWVRFETHELCGGGGGGAESLPISSRMSASGSSLGILSTKDRR